MKKIILLISILLISSFCFIIFVKNKPIPQVSRVIDDVSNSEENKNVDIINVDKNDIRIDSKNEKNIATNVLNKNILMINNIVEGFKTDNFKIKNSVEGFFQISNSEINSDDIKDNQCILNLVSKNSDLSVCDFVKAECLDMECEKYDCVEDKNNWFNISYYGDFVGSGDKELVYKNKNEIIVANLECKDKTKENYDNKLFQDLIAK